MHDKSYDLRLLSTLFADAPRQPDVVGDSRPDVIYTSHHAVLFQTQLLVNGQSLPPADNVHHWRNQGSAVVRMGVKCTGKRGFV